MTHSMGARILFAAFERLSPQLATLDEQAQGLTGKVREGLRPNASGPPQTPIPAVQAATPHPRSILCPPVSKTVASTMTILNADYPRDWFVERDLPMASKYCDRITVTVDTGDQALVVSAESPAPRTAQQPAVRPPRCGHLAPNSLFFR